MDTPQTITALATLVTAIGGVIAIILTRRSVGQKLDTVHELVNSKSQRDAEYLVQLIDLLKAEDIDVPVNRTNLETRDDNPPPVPDRTP